MSSIAGEQDGSRAGAPGRELGSARMAGPGFVGFEPLSVTVASTESSSSMITTARALAATDVKGLSDDECLGVLDDVELARRSLDAFAAGLSAEVDFRALCDVRYGSTTGSWFERRHGRSRVSVGREVRIGARLRSGLGDLHAAALRGEITFERVAFVVSKTNSRNLDAMAAAQSALLELSAVEDSFPAFCALIDDLARYADSDGGHSPDADSSRMALRRVGDDVVVDDGVFVGAEGLTLEQLVEAATDRLWRQHRRDRETCPELASPTRVELRARAFAELIRRGAAADPDSAGATVSELNLVIDADRVEDLDPLLADILDGPDRDHHGRDHAHDGNDGRDHAHDGRVHTPDGNSNSNGVCSGRWGSPGVGDLIGVPVTGAAGAKVWFTPGQWQLLVCNADISETILDRLGMPVAVRDRARFPDRAMRRSLVARDGGCVFPGCDTPAGWCDAHHVIGYAADGRTVMVNLALLCRHHHGVVHRTGWQMQRNRHVGARSGPAGARNDGFFTISTPDGLQLSTRHRPRTGSRAPARDPDRPAEPA